jgi:ferredoxin
MTVKFVRKVVHIDEDKCNGCGVCVPSCAEGALKIIDGKAKLVSDKHCDGLGACLGECPRGAINIEERPAEEFDEEAAKLHQELDKHPAQENISSCPSVQVRDLWKPDDEKSACGCSSATVKEIERAENDIQPIAFQPSQLRHWPVQLTLVPLTAPFLKGADVVLAADCTAFADAGFHQDFLKNHVLIIACPKLDDFEAHVEKLTQIIAHSGLKSLTVVHMEVPCCSGLVFMAKKSIEAAGKQIPVKEITIRLTVS